MKPSTVVDLLLETDPLDLSLKRLLGYVKYPSLSIYLRTIRWHDDESDDCDDNFELVEEFSCKPDEYDIEEGLDAVKIAANKIKSYGFVEPSSSYFNPGVWYVTEDTQRTDGSYESYSFHPKNFAPRQEEELFRILTTRR